MLMRISNDKEEKFITYKKIKRKFLFWCALGIGILSSSYALSHRFLHDRMPFNCHQIGCMAGEPDEVAATCRCGEVNILALPCKGKVDCQTSGGSCPGGRYCMAYLPDCLKDADCVEIDLEAPPSVEELETGN
jgi:hypothetical protein